MTDCVLRKPSKRGRFVLRELCEHGHYDEHTYLAEGGDPESSIAYKECPGGREITATLHSVRESTGACLYTLTPEPDGKSDG